MLALAPVCQALALHLPKCYRRRGSSASPAWQLHLTILRDADIYPALIFNQFWKHSKKDRSGTARFSSLIEDVPVSRPFGDVARNAPRRGPRTSNVRKKECV
jgi:hypothetical protein